MFKKISLALTFTLLNLNCHAVTEKSYFMLDIGTKTILDSKNSDRKIYPASLTKLMVAYIVLENVKNKKLTISDSILDFYDPDISDGIIVNKEQKINTSIFESLNAMMTHSSNDCGWILAHEILKKYDTFVSKMNQTAQELGMNNTNFTNLDGLFDKENYSTARDIGILMYAIQRDFPEFLPFLNNQQLFKNGQVYEKKTTIDNDMYGIIASKTGYIDASGRNLAVIFKSKNSNAVIVSIGNDSYVEANMKIAKLLKKNIKTEELEINEKNLEKYSTFAQFLETIFYD